MNLDLLSVSVMTAVVATVAGSVFIAETLIRRDRGAGRLWAVAYLSGMATTFSYMAWTAGIGGAFTIASGNALFVCVPGFMWLGCRRFNERARTLVPPAILAALAAVTFVSALVTVPVQGSWGGWAQMSVCIVLLFGAGAYECARRPMNRVRSAWALGAVLAAAALYYLVRVTLFLTLGPTDAFFDSWFGTISANMMTVILTMVAVIVTTVLRSTKTEVQRYEWLSDSGVAADGILLARPYHRAVDDICERAGWRQELVAVIVIQITGLDEMEAAFGHVIVDRIAERWRSAVRRFAPAASSVGEDVDGALSVCGLAMTAADARRQAAAIYRGCVDELSGLDRGLLPQVGVGVALTETLGYDAKRLLAAARIAAVDAARSVEASVLIGGVGGSRPAHR